ncbi:MAG: GTP 3',8-cyclase MoaA [Acidobacteria bacterium]|nr:GTP 3',8-cyclase MoaA [Acidobacteriota bacterium]MCB9397415.1 GTP 3',8-cyclase MoaA [Acidobacteriota bacterium]
MRDRLQRPLQDLRISVTDRCNLRCQYCMPADRDYHFMPNAHVLRYEEIERLVRIFVALGVEKVRLTGGEPLIRRDLSTLVGKLSSIPGLRDLGLTTNGMFLSEKVGGLVANGLKRITVSLDSLEPKVLEVMSGRSDLQTILAGLEKSRKLGLRPIKVNCVLVRGLNEPHAMDMVAWARESGFEMRFIEYMDVGTLNTWGEDRVVPGRELLARIQAQFPCEPEIQPEEGRVAQTFRFLDGKGRFGLINSVSEPFCRGCTRARLSADGQLFTCLFAQSGVDLKTPLRTGATDDEILATIKTIWTNRTDRYSEIRQEAQGPRQRIEMFQIGG